MKRAASAAMNAMGDLRLLWLFVRVGALHALAYRGNLLVQLLYSGIGLCGSLAFLAAVFARTDTLAGWRPAEVVALWGVFTLLTGALGVVVQPSLQRLPEDVWRGTLDFTLVKPADAQVLASVGQVEVWKLVDVGLGLGLLGIAFVQIGGQVGLFHVLAFAVTLAAGAAVIYSCCLALATLSFWFVRVDNVLLVFLTCWEAGRWPVTIYPGWLRMTLTVLVPVALATTVPAEALAGRLSPAALLGAVAVAGRLSPAALLGAVAVAGLLLAAARWFWCLGLRHYTGASA